MSHLSAQSIIILIVSFANYSMWKVHAEKVIFPVSIWANVKNIDFQQFHFNF